MTREQRSMWAEVAMDLLFILVVAGGTFGSLMLLASAVMSAK